MKWLAENQECHYKIKSQYRMKGVAVLCQASLLFCGPVTLCTLSTASFMMCVVAKIHFSSPKQTNKSAWLIKTLFCLRISFDIISSSSLSLAS